MDQRKGETELEKKTMKSAVLRAVRDIEIRQLPVPAPGPRDVLIKVMACGVCGTDVHIFEGEKGAADNPLPIVLGHEFAGVVERTGSDVTDLAKGDAVCVDPNVMCGHCYYCRSGIGHFCERMIGIGTTVNGGFSEYCAVPRQAVYRLGKGVPFEAGAMAEPLACCLHGIDLCEIAPGSDVLVMGGGMIGLLMLQLAKLSGAARVALAEPVAGKRADGHRLGADLCIDPTAGDVKQALLDAGIERVDTVIECVGKPSTIEQAIDIAGKRSVVMMFGLTKPDEEIRVRPFEVFRKEVTLKTSFINPYTLGRAVELINQGRIDVSSMLAEVIPLERLAEVLADGRLRSKGKYAVNPQQ
jgi:2-desacetyl-2-hydroxyethyl bacteriochlorophyllide A dehydrogenase